MTPCSGTLTQWTVRAPLRVRVGPNWGAPPQSSSPSPSSKGVTQHSFLWDITYFRCGLYTQRATLLLGMEDLASMRGGLASTSRCVVSDARSLRLCGARRPRVQLAVFAAHGRSHPASQRQLYGSRAHEKRVADTSTSSAALAAGRPAVFHPSREAARNASRLRVAVDVDEGEPSSIASLTTFQISALCSFCSWSLLGASKPISWSPSLPCLQSSVASFTASTSSV